MKDLSVFQLILLAVFAALAVSSVLVFALLVSGGGGTGVGPITIWGTLDGNAFATVIRQAAEDNGDLRQVTYIQKDEATYESDLTNALANGIGPDLFLLRQDYAVKDAGRVIPIPSNFLPEADVTKFKNVFIEAADPYLSSDGPLGIPLLADPLVLYWNRDLLGAAGFSEPPQYWDELSHMAEKIVKKNDAGTIQKSAVSFGEYANVDHAKDIVAMLVLQAGGFITTRDTSGRVVPSLSARTGASSQATESALRFYTEFSDPSKVDYSWNRSLPTSRAAFAAGDLALYFGYGSEQSVIGRMNPNLNFAVTPVPQIRGGDRVLGLARVYALATTRTSRNPGGAIKIAATLAGTGMSTSLSFALGIPSARRDVLSIPVQGDDELFNKQVILGRSWIDPDPEKTNDIFRAMIEGVTSGSARLTEAIQRADQEMAQLIGQ